MPSTPDRREFLLQSAALGGSLGTLAAQTLAAPIISEPPIKRCILLLLTGGPSQIDTWDPKPNAPCEVRGPFNPIRTTVPGLLFSECFPRMAAQAHRFCVVRSLHHDAAPIHEIGFQLLQTGHLATEALEYPHFSLVAARAAQVPAIFLGEAIHQTGMALSCGQSSGFFTVPENAVSRIVGNLSLEERLSLAVEQVQHGGMVTVNLFSSLFGQLTWDCHADRGSLPTTLNDYRETICPRFDRAFTRLLDQLEETGLLESTLVIALGEMGRNPHINPRGGRDHWTRASTMLLAGAGVPGGAVIGATDRLGGEVVDTPIDPTQLVGNLYRLLGTILPEDRRFDAMRHAPAIPGLR